MARRKGDSASDKKIDRFLENLHPDDLALIQGRAQQEGMDLRAYIGRELSPQRWRELRSLEKDFFEGQELEDQVDFVRFKALRRKQQLSPQEIDELVGLTKRFRGYAKLQASRRTLAAEVQKMAEQQRRFEEE